MKYCPFCGSPAAAWPEYASDYVRGYYFCEYHRDLFLSRATIYVYDSKIKELEDRRCSLESNLWSLIQDWEDSVSKDAPESHIDEDGDDWVGNEVARKARSQISPWRKPDYGTPLNVYIDDAEIDRMVAKRIKDFAGKSEQGQNVMRCSGHKPDSPDERCTYYAEVGSDRCWQCSRAGRLAAMAFNDNSKIEKIMEIIRDQ